QQRLIRRIVRQVHDAISVQMAGLAAVIGPPCFGVAYGKQQISRYVKFLGRLLKIIVKRTGVEMLVGWRRANDDRRLPLRVGRQLSARRGGESGCSKSADRK